MIIPCAIKCLHRVSMYLAISHYLHTCLAQQQQQQIFKIQRLQFTIKERAYIYFPLAHKYIRTREKLYAKRLNGWTDENIRNCEQRKMLLQIESVFGRHQTKVLCLIDLKFIYVQPLQFFFLLSLDGFTYFAHPASLPYCLFFFIFFYSVFCSVLNNL